MNFRGDKMVTYSLFSDKGNRDNNEDYVGNGSNGEMQCFILADGLGGHGRGEVASQLVVEEGINLLSKYNDLERYVSKAFEIAQEKLLKYQNLQHAKNEMKSTEVILALNGQQAVWGHVGDSRLYVFKGHKVKKRTMDHSYVQNLCRAGRIKEKDIRNHPDRNVVLRVMGIQWDKPAYEMADSIKLKKNMSFLLCTDGFWELILEKDMEKCLKMANNPEEWIALMKTIIVNNGKNVNMDNYSAIAVWVR